MMSQQMAQGVDDLMPSRVKEWKKRMKRLARDAKTPEKLIKTGLVIGQSRRRLTYMIKHVYIYDTHVYSFALSPYSFIILY
jgi:hypothetical protein